VTAAVFLVILVIAAVAALADVGFEKR